MEVLDEKVEPGEDGEVDSREAQKGDGPYLVVSADGH